MNKIILLTGATSDLSICYLESIKNQNKTIIAFFRNHQERLNAFNGSSLNIIPVQCDLANLTEVKEKISNLNNLYQIDSVIHIASPTVKNERFNKINIDDFTLHLQVQLFSIIEILKIVLLSMKKRKQGKVIFILSSITIGTPPKYWSQYVVAKYAVLGLMKSLAAEYSSFNIQINAISPSMFESKFLINQDDLVKEMYIKNHPMKTLLDKSEIISLISFLLENNDKFLIGNNFNLSGSEII